MSTFNSINPPRAPEPQPQGQLERSPTTPRPNTTQTPSEPSQITDPASTPTRASFSLAGQISLPQEPFPPPNSFNNVQHATDLERGDSTRSARSSRDSADVNMDEDDEASGSEEGSLSAGGTQSKKKKKKNTQKFFCTNYPPCRLSFTRSEHLARHVRKHTGERPFECHCGRKFSRLDNLRQHSQTVHAHEQIPTDSLAASGTRFQRQGRPTDRVRPPGSRPRAGTAGSQVAQSPAPIFQSPHAAQVRGHTRNAFSTSSIASVASSYGTPADTRRRPAPLSMAGVGPQTPSDMYRNPFEFPPRSPVPFTPSSATFSSGTGPNSPRYGSAMHSPTLSHSRTQSLFEEHRTPGRRSSLTNNPFYSTRGTHLPPMPGSTGFRDSTPSYTPSMGSPTTPSSSAFSRRDSVSSARDDPSYRRRTWHPDTNPYGSMASRFNQREYHPSGPYQQVPVVPSNAPPLRLPSISSFDPLARGQSPVRRQPSPMDLDTVGQSSHASLYGTGERPRSQAWETEIRQGVDHLELSQRPDAGSWAREADRAVQSVDPVRTWTTETNRDGHTAERVMPVQPLRQVQFEESPYSARTQQNLHHQSAPPVTPTSAKRNGWYNGPITARPSPYTPIDPHILRPSPEDSSSSEGVPGTPYSGGHLEYHPSIMHSNGHVETRMPPMPPNDSRVLRSNAPLDTKGYMHPTNGHNHGFPESQAHTSSRAPPRPSVAAQVPPSVKADTTALDALVAVATSESSRSATAY